MISLKKTNDWEKVVYYLEEAFNFFGYKDIKELKASTLSDEEKASLLEKIVRLSSLLQKLYHMGQLDATI